MEAFSSPTQKVQVEGEKDDQVIYVEELGGEGDYWLSITDAARVCRVQDISIRRAIARGALPVRRQRAGQNKRTRFVRASDLPAGGFPIIDESAAITTEIGKADILSIPRQQQRILQDHQALMTRLQEMQETLESSQARLLADLQQHKAEAQAGLQAHREEQALQLASTETHLLQQQEKLQHNLTTAEQHLTQELQSTREDLACAQEETLQREASLRKTMREHQVVFAEYQKDVQRSLAELEEQQQQRLQAYQHAVEQRFLQAEQEVRARFTTLEQEISGRLEKYSQRCEAQLASMAHQVSQLQLLSENLNNSMVMQQDEQARIRQLQQEQGNQLTRLSPLLPYVHQTLLTEHDSLAWTKTLADLEKNFSMQLRSEFARYQPLLDLLSPERLAMLARLLDEKESSNGLLET